MKIGATTKIAAAATPLAFDTEFWGLPVARANRLDGLTEWARESTAGLVWLLAEAPEEVQRAEASGFRFTDIRVELRRRTGLLYPASFVRAARPEDTETLAAIARVSHRVTRFYADPQLPDDRCDDLYETWIRQSLDGWADTVLVVEDEGRPAGYVTVHVDGETSSIGLIAVAEPARNRGYGGALVRAAVGHGLKRGATDMSVVTQGRNIAAQRLFQSCGFRTSATAVWLHSWMYRDA